MSSVLFTPKAQEDLLDIAFYIAQDNVDAAHHLIEKVQRTCDLIATSPEMGRLRPELASGMRSFAIDKYLVFYRIAGDAITVLRVLHGARDIEQMF